MQGDLRCSLCSASSVSTRLSVTSRPQRLDGRLQLRQALTAGLSLGLYSNMAIATIAAAPTKVRAGGEILLYVFAQRPVSPCPCFDPIAAQSDSCEIPRDYSAARETDLDCLGLAAGFWLSIGTTND